jgi:hypothetical protein
MNSDHQLQAATKKLPVSAVLFGVLAGFIGVGGRTNSRFCFGLGPRGRASRSPMEGWGRLFCRRDRAHRDAHRYHLPANPMKAKYRAWSDWQKPDYIAQGGEQPSRASSGSDYQIRYKLDYQDR